MRIASYGHFLGGAVGLSMLEGVGEPRPSVRCADAGVLLRGVPTADSPRGDSPMASRPLAVGCVPIYTAELHFHTTRRAVLGSSFRHARRIGHFRLPLPRRTGPELDAAQLGSRRAPSAKMKTKHKLEVSGPTMHLAHAYPGPEITHACTREPTIAAFSTWTHQAARLAVS